MEPFSIIAAVASITQLIGYTHKAISSVHEYQGAIRGAPAEIESLLAEADSFLSYFSALQHDLLSSQTPLSTSVNDCINLATKIQDLLKPLAISGTESKIKALRKAASFQRKTTAINKLLSKLERRKTSLLVFRAL